MQTWVDGEICVILRHDKVVDWFQLRASKLDFRTFKSDNQRSRTDLLPSAKKSHKATECDHSAFVDAAAAVINSERAYWIKSGPV